MQATNTQQEILLNRGSQFAHREWSEREDAAGADFSQEDALQKACWNGLLKEMLPEIDPELLTGKKLWLWEVRQTKSFLELELSDFPSPKEKGRSIDPYTFLLVQDFN